METKLGEGNDNGDQGGGGGGGGNANGSRSECNLSCVMVEDHDNVLGDRIPLDHRLYMAHTLL